MNARVDSRGREGRHVVLYDGVCGLCNRSVRFLVARDRSRLFAYSPLQSEYSRDVLARHGFDATKLETVHVVVEAGTENERVLRKSRAVFFVLRQLGGFWRMLSLLRFIPPPVSDFFYGLVARVRYRMFGRHETCPIPPAEHRARFIEI